MTNNLSPIVSRDKRGLSAVISNLLIIVLVIVAVGIIWTIVQNVLTGSKSKINPEKLGVRVEVTGVSNDGHVLVKRGTDEANITNLKVALYDEDGTSNTTDAGIDKVPDPLETVDTGVDVTNTTTRIKVAPEITTEKGESQWLPLQGVYKETEIIKNRAP